MRQYRKKPVVISAMQLKDSDFTGDHPNPDHISGVVYDPIAKCAFVETLEGRMQGNVGDWLLRGVKNELYFCKNDIFQLTYEPVEYVVEDVHAETLAILANDNLSDLTIADIRSRLEEKFGGKLVDAARRSIMEGA